MKKNNFHKNTPRLLVIAPARHSRGGISVVAATLFDSAIFKEWNKKWLETMDDRSTVQKLISFARAFFIFIFVIGRCDLVHVHTSSGTSFFRKSLFIIVSRLMRKRIIVHIHPAHFSEFIAKSNLFVKKYIFFALQSADCLIFLSDRIGQQVSFQLPHSPKFHVLPNPCPYSALAEPLKPRAPVIFFAGKLMEAKGCRELLNAFKKVLPHMPDARLVMAGNGHVEFYRSLATDLGVQDYVFFPGWLTGKELLVAYRDAAVFCLPSHSEGLPMSLIEAMSQGAAVVATPVGGIPDVIQHEVNGLLVPVNDQSALTDALLLLLENPAIRESLSHSALRTIRSQYEQDVIGEKLSKIYCNETI